MSLQWLSEDVYTLTSRNIDKQSPLIDKYITMGIPALGQYQGGFLAEMGDIQVCLNIQIQKNNEISVSVCGLNDSGQMETRYIVSGDPATVLIKAFITDFPEAVLTTPQLKPFVLMLADPKTKVSGEILGPMTFRTFSKILADTSIQQQNKHIIVAIQK
jgi:hypothetical protein